jgi:hypothetical protein
LGVIGVLRQRSRVAQLHKVGYIQRRSLVHPDVDLLYRDCKEVPRKPGATNMTPVKTEAQKDVKWPGEQSAVKIAAGKPKGSRPIHAC